MRCERGRGSYLLYLQQQHLQHCLQLQQQLPLLAFLVFYLHVVRDEIAVADTLAPGVQ